MTTRAPLALALAAAAALPGAGCRKEVPAPPVLPRPVTVLELAVVDPSRPARIAGAARSWKEQDLSFEVPGRLVFVAEAGTNILGGSFRGDAAGEGNREPVARVDTETLAITRDRAAAEVDVARAQLEAARIKLEKALPAAERSARADFDRAEAELLRYSQAFQRDAVAEVDVIRSRADRDGAAARLEEAAAAISHQAAEIARIEAQIRESGEKLRLAESDLARTVLHAPFPGEISATLKEVGGYVHVGDPVLHLVMMDPIRVDVNVSPEMARGLRMGDPVNVYVPGAAEPLVGTVYEKGTVADARTRTLLVSVLQRNVRTVPAAAADPSLASLPRISRPFFVEALETGTAGSPLFVEENRTLRRDADGSWYVWAAPSVRKGAGLDPRRPVTTLRKVKVVPGEISFSLMGLYQVRSLRDHGTLEPGMMLALDAPEDLADGAEVLVSGSEWALKPGQVAEVLFRAGEGRPGLHLPMSAVKPGPDGGTGTVFLEIDGKAKEVKVLTGRVVRELVPVEAADEAGRGLLVPGARVVADFVQFLVDGEPVQVLRSEKVKP